MSGLNMAGMSVSSMQPQDTSNVSWLTEKLEGLENLSLSDFYDGLRSFMDGMEVMGDTTDIVQGVTEGKPGEVIMGAFSLCSNFVEAADNQQSLDTLAMMDEELEEVDNMDEDNDASLSASPSPSPSIH